MFRTQYGFNGYILLSLLIMMQIVIITSMTIFILILRHHSVSSQQLQKTDYHYEILSILDRLRNKGTPGKSCFINGISPAELVNKKLAWWKANTCSGNFNEIRYYYAFEDFGVYPCVKVSMGIGTKLAHYMRLSVYFSFDHFRGRSVWQATWVYPDPLAEVCDREGMSIINAGVQTIHELV